MLPKLKICGMKYPDNIEEVLTVNPDFLGFIFYAKSPRYAESLSAGWLRRLTEVCKVGVFVNEELAVIRQRVADYGLDAVQLHGDETAGMALELKQLGISVIKAFGVDADFDWEQLKAFESVVDYFLFDTKSTMYGGTGRAFDWDLLKQYQLDKPYFLSGGIGLADIPTLDQLSDERIFAVDVNSRFESAPGRKDITLLRSAFGHKSDIK